MRLKKKGIRQPQVRKSGPEIWLTARTARLARNKPQGTPNCGQEAMKPRVSRERAHSMDMRTEPPHSPPTPTPWMNRKMVRMIAPQMPMLS